MVHIKISKGLNIPIKGRPEDQVQRSQSSEQLPSPKLIGLDVTPFEEIKFKLLCKAGDVVKIGQPLLEDKDTPGRLFVSPAGGTVKEIRRGLKRRLLAIVIEVAQQEEYHELPPLDATRAFREELIARLKEGGLFAHIRQRPFNLLADPRKEPRAIFVKAIESAPFVPPAEIQVLGHEKAFQAGLSALAKMTTGAVNLVYSHDSSCQAFTEARDVQKHTAEGPHPIGTHSVHIHFISPIQNADDTVWTLNVLDVIAIGHLMTTGRYYIERKIGIGGPAILDGKVGFFSVRMGYPIEGLIAGRIQKGLLRLISGDVLTGDKVEAGDFLGFYHTAFCVVPENTSREFLHFFRTGVDKYSASRAYLSGHLDNSDRQYDFTTSLHGEPRAFVVSSPYEKVMPMRIPVMHLVKAIMAEDFELAETLGLFEVDAEDFALSTFVCPSKVEMIEIMKSGLKAYSKQILA